MQKSAYPDARPVSPEGPETSATSAWASINVSLLNEQPLVAFVTPINPFKLVLEDN